jgi:hypothetical protein
VDSRLRRSPPDRASAVPYGQAGENAMRFPRLAHRSAAAHKLHSTPQQDRMNLISGKDETSSRLPAFSLFLPGSCPNYRDRRRCRTYDCRLTPDERARILIAAREAEPHIHWLNWLSSFNGGRLSELAEADTRDIVTKEGVSGEIYARACGPRPNLAAGPYPIGSGILGAN